MFWSNVSLFLLLRLNVRCYWWYHADVWWYLGFLDEFWFFSISLSPYKLMTNTFYACTKKCRTNKNKWNVCTCNKYWYRWTEMHIIVIFMIMVTGIYLYYCLFIILCTPGQIIYISLFTIYIKIAGAKT